MFRDAGKCFRHQWIESMILSIEYIWFRKTFGGLPEKRGGAHVAAPYLVCADHAAGRMAPPSSRPHQVSLSSSLFKLEI